MSVRGKPGHQNNAKEIVGTGFRFEMGRAIRKRRLSLGLTLRQAVDRTSGQINFTSWGEYERGDKEPGIYRFAAMIQALELHDSPWELLVNSLLTGCKHGGHRNEGGTKRRQRRAASPYRDDRGQDGSRKDSGEMDKEGTV